MSTPTLVALGTLLLLTQLHEVSVSRVNVKNVIDASADEDGHTYDSDALQQPFPLTNWSASHLPIQEQFVHDASRTSFVSADGYHFATMSGLRNNSHHSNDDSGAFIGPPISYLVPAQQSVLQAQAFAHPQRHASRSFEAAMSLTRHTTEATVQFPPRLLALAGQRCLEEGQYKQMGCVKCACAWNKQCYPKFVPSDEDVMDEHGGFNMESALINVGICETSMALLVLASIALFLTVLVSFVACRTLLQWCALERQEKAEMEAMKKHGFISSIVKASVVPPVDLQPKNSETSQATSSATEPEAPPEAVLPATETEAKEPEATVVETLQYPEGLEGYVSSDSEDETREKPRES